MIIVINNSMYCRNTADDKCIEMRWLEVNDNEKERTINYENEMRGKSKRHSKCAHNCNINRPTSSLLCCLIRTTVVSIMVAKLLDASLQICNVSVLVS